MAVRGVVLAGDRTATGLPATAEAEQGAAGESSRAWKVNALTA